MSLTQINKAGLDEIALDHVFTIGASGSSAYTFQGEGLNGTVNNPTLYLTRGKTYRFENGSGGHPIRIQSTSGASGTAYNTGVTNNAGSGTVIVEVQHDAPDVLYYQCTSHAAMNGILYITGALADGGVTTAKIAASAVVTDSINNSAVTADKIANDAVGTTKLGGSAVTTAKLADNAVTGAKISDSTITGSKLAANTVDHGHIATDAVRTAEIQNSAVTTAKLTTAAKNAEDGLVKYLRTGDGVYTIFTPDGSTVSTSGTTTEGLQEAINYANTNGFDFYCAGGGIETDGTATDVGVISCSTSLQIPACQLRSFVFKNTTIDFTTAVGSNAGLKFDSFMMMDFDFAGQIVYHGNGNAVEFDAVNNVPYDGFKTQVDSRVKIDTIAYVEGGTDASPNSACISFKQTQGAATLRNSFIFGEINGSGYNAGTATVTLVARNGIVLNHSGVKYNIFDIQGIHHFKEAGLIVGQSVASPAPVGNQFRIGVMEPYRVTSGGSVVALGLRSYGGSNHYTFSITNNGGTNQNGITGAFSYAVKFESSCSEEFVNVLDCVGAQDGVITSSSSNNNTLYHKGNKLDGTLLIGTPNKSVFNGAGGNSQMIVAGTDTATNVVSNVNASITISNRDGTANNLAGLHFAREDNDGIPHYCGASIVAQFKEAQTDGTYPSADLNFLTSHGHGAAPRVAATLHRPGYFTTPYVPFFRVDGPDSNATYSGVITWSNLLDNPGGHFKATAGAGSMQRFIAPVDGHYLFTLGFFPNSAASFRVQLRINGNDRTDPYITGGFSAWGTGAPVPSGAQILKLSANDYVDVNVSSGTMTNTYGGHTGWQGILLT